MRNTQTGSGKVGKKNLNMAYHQIEQPCQIFIVVSEKEQSSAE